MTKKTAVVLLTGCAGFIGYHTSLALLRRGTRVLGLDCVNAYYSPGLKEERLKVLQQEGGSRFSFFRGELEDAALVEQIFRTEKPDTVIHLAGQAGVRYSIENPRAYISANISGFLNILEACRNYGVSHLAFASSSSVYGMNRRAPFRETDGADHPVSLYAATKRADELMAHAYSTLFALPATGMRFFTVYGPMGRPDMAYFKFAQAILAGKPIDVYNNGDLLRDFTYIDDVVRAVVQIADRPAQADPDFDPGNPLPDRSSAPFRVYNIGNSKPETLMHFIGILEDKLGRRAVKKFLPMQAGDVYMTAADTSALERDFGWKPSTPLEQGLEEFCRWFLARNTNGTENGKP